MFRKDSGLISGWLERGPKEYAVLQKQILDCALAMLRPGGMLLYSTCTFAKEEDEDVIADALMRHPDLELVQAEGADGLTAGYPPCEKALRVWPHHAEGEGHFLALLHKTGEAPAAASKKMHTVRNEKLPQEVRDFLAEAPGAALEGTRLPAGRRSVSASSGRRGFAGRSAVFAHGTAARHLQKGTVRAVSGACNGAFCAFLSGYA